MTGSGSVDGSMNTKKWFREQESGMNEHAVHCAVGCRPFEMPGPANKMLIIDIKCCNLEFMNIFAKRKRTRMKRGFSTWCAALRLLPAEETQRDRTNVIVRNNNN